MRMKHLLLVMVALGGLFCVVDLASAQTWTLTSAPIKNWWSVATSADGNKLVAVVYGGLIYTSTNSGATWSSNSAPSKSWISVASSVDGGKLVAVVDNGPIYTSTNSGNTWVSNSAPVSYGIVSRHRRMEANWWQWSMVA
jgi:photosystem II stability/assembly factor-like uncharacterized protein